MPSRDVERAKEREAALERIRATQDFQRQKAQTEAAVRQADAAERANKLSIAAIAISIIALIVAIAGLFFHT